LSVFLRVLCQKCFEKVYITLETYYNPGGQRVAKATLMKAGESKKEIMAPGVLYRNVINIDKLEANVTHMLPSAKTDRFSHEGQEIKFVVKGEVEYHVGNEKYLLQKGDMLHHPSNETHWSKNIGTKEAIYVTISTPPTFTPFHK
jgi:quercetin dioxygenase-like cupin family protein